MEIGANNRIPFSLEEHQELGKSLKVHANFLENTAWRIGKSIDKSKVIQKDIDIARKALARVQQNMHISMMNDFISLPDSELLPIYLGRLEPVKGNADDK
jgi:hypothetical protein